MPLDAATAPARPPPAGVGSPASPLPNDNPKQPPPPAPPTAHTQQGDAAFEGQLRQQALWTAGATLLLAVVVAASPWRWWMRLLASGAVAAAGLYTLSFRTHSLLLDHNPPTISPYLSSTLHSSTPSSSDHPSAEGEIRAREGDVKMESAEWLNGVMSNLWPIVDRQLFVAVVDLMEDAMKAESPAVVRSTRITSLSPGAHPVRLLGLRVLPSSPTQPFTHFHTLHPEAGTTSGEDQPVQSTSAFNDPTRPEPAPWGADPEEQGEAQHPAASGGVRSPVSAAARDKGESSAFAALKGPSAIPAGESSPSSGPEAAPPGKRLERESIPAGSAPSREGREVGKAGEERGAIPGPFVELEVEFGYRRATQTKGKEEDEGALGPEEATRNIHFVTYIGIGASKILTIPVPVLISVTHLHGFVHLRLQLVPEPPFVKSIAFGLRGMPDVGIAAHPLSGPLDIMTLPLLRSYILSAVRSVMSGFVLPRHYAVDLRKIMLGGDVAMKTRTTGLLVLVLHRATSLPASDPSLRPLHLPHLPGKNRAGGGTVEEVGTERAEWKRKDRRGKSDPFVEVGWAGMGKAMYKSKIVASSLDPVWEEVVFVRVPQEPIEDGGKIRLTVKDHDRYSSDDTLGYVDLPIAAFAGKPGEWTKNKRLPLRGGKEGEIKEGQDAEREGEHERGSVEFSAAYFPICDKLVDAQQPDKGAETEEGSPADMADWAEREKESDEEHERRKRKRMEKLDEMLNARHPAPLSHPSGILAYQIHQIADLELPKRAGVVQKTVRAAFAPGGTSSIRKADVPSSYVQAFVNEEMVYRTRLKPFSNAPYFNAGAETLLRDWQQGTVSFAVMDYRDRDHDVMVGFVHLQLKEMLQDKCQITKWFPITGGAGSGRLRISLLFKPLAMKIPRGLREWSIGTLEVLEARVEGAKEGLSASLKFGIEQGGKGTTEVAEATQDGSLHFPLRQPLHLPVLSRLSPVGVTLEEKHSLTKDRAAGYAMLWMNDIVRGEPQEMRLELSDERPLRVPNPHDLPTLDTTAPSGEKPATAHSQPPPPTIRLGQPTPPQRNALTPSMLPPAISQHDPPSSSSPESAPADLSSRPTLILRLRWRPGVSIHHSDLVLSSSSAARASYQLFLHRQDHLASLRQDKREARAMGQDAGPGTGPGGAAWEGAEGANGGDWESSGEEEGKPEIVPKGDGRRTRKGGTLRWMAHSAKVATRRLADTRHHHIDDPKPETELQSAL
ncbi:hypothetical protein JCM10213_002327 [Rhodosporidiobolus nylandii]